MSPQHAPSTAATHYPPCDRVAVVGYGYWGSKHVRVLSSIPGVEVTIVDGHTPRLADAAAHHPAARLATHLDHVLDDIDAVVIATPPGSHAAIAHRALGAGKHTLVEKPFTTSVEDGERLVRMAREQDVRLMVGHTFEYNPAVRKLRELVRSGALGQILYVDTARLSLGRYQSDVNVIWDLAPHDISIVSYVLDEMPSSTAVWAHSHITSQHPDVAHLRFDFCRSHTRAYVHVSWLTPNKVRQVTVVGEKKMAVYDDMSDNERIRIYDIGVDVEAIEGPPQTQALPVSYRTGDIVSPYIAFEEPLLVQDQHFLTCVRTGATPDTPGERGLDVVRVLAATDRALQAAGREVLAPTGSSDGLPDVATTGDRRVPDRPAPLTPSPIAS
ncbi:Gfo/Idh/MocA family protein [Geodermatophilus ruber]|uniref:Predicted dehydrogenase n=1 Tax=Geodermatophilus ruber TaxID=504800 RepID=A0A1I4LBS7_9ACTN|nr:Gfo/Idh/MocA family oxidoreductase [Geodermatophilus ruber]SFL88077.1 Predicted dehydrogenase [Geodermatophilus ruber]